MASPHRNRNARYSLAILLSMLLFTAGCQPGTTAAQSNPRPARDAHHHGAAAPGQRWGNAAGLDHEVDGPSNHTVPRSERGRYPVRADRPVPKAPANRAHTAAAPAAKPAGFTPKASRELPALRRADQRTYQNPDGTQTTEFATEPLNYRRSGGDWAPINTGLVASGTGWRPRAGGPDLTLAGRADAPELVRLGLGTTVFAYGLAGAAPVRPAVAGSTATYRAVLPGVDLELSATAAGAKETLVLAARSSTPRRFVFPLAGAGLRATMSGGQIVLTDATGTTRAVVPAGLMSDAAGAVSTAVTYRIVTSAGRPAIELTADAAWLADPARRYPVRLDPSVQAGVADSSMVVQGGSSRAGGAELLVGNVGGNAASSYLKFSGLAGALQNETIYGAQLQAVNYDSASCSPRAVTVNPVTAGWTAGSGYSYPGPAVGDALTSSSFAYGYIATGQVSSACPVTEPALFDLGARGRDLVQSWVDGGVNNGLSLRASTSDSKAWKRFTGQNSANPPRLYVTHTPYNATYAIPKPVPDPPVLQNQSGVVQVTVTNKGAEAWSPGAYYLAYRAFKITDDGEVAAGQQRAADLTTTLARGASATLAATIKPLPPGTYFLDFTMVKTGGVVFTDEQVPPGRIVLQVVDIPPVVQALYPPNGYQAPTLTPQLWAQAVDIDAPPASALSYRFQYCELTDAGAQTGCVDSGYQTSQAYAVPGGKLSWSKTYQWRASVKDASNEVFSDWTNLLTTVPQPEITSRIAAAPYGSQEHEFDAQTGNFSTAAIDASVASVGPDLRVVRTYNSADPRRDLAFGAGWVTQLDMRLTPDDDGSGNIVVTYPDGQQVRYGQNPDGTYAAPQGRVATLTASGTTYTLADRAGMKYQFVNNRLQQIADAANRKLVLTYATTGLLAKVQVSNSQSNTAGRALTFGWTGAHVTSVTSDVAQTWTYAYAGDLLTTVCAPGTAECTHYEYGVGSHYRGAVLDSRPESYWRLGEAQGTAAGSEVAVNLGKDAGTLQNVTLATPGALTGTTNTAATFNGTTSAVDLPKGTLKKSRDSAVELWFKMSATQAGGPLLGYQDAALGATSTNGVPMLYVDANGLLHGQFRTGTVSPISAAAPISRNAWHHVVLSAMGATQTLYLDGARVGTLTGAIDHADMTYNQIGAAYATAPASWPGYGGTAKRSFAGSIDEVAVYSHPLGPAAVKAHYTQAAKADQMSRTLMPSGNIASAVTYDTALDRVKEYTDRNGGTWKIGAPAVFGGNTDLRRTVQVRDPADRPYLYEYDAIAGRLLRTGSPLGLTTRAEDQPGYPSPSPTPSPTPTQVCNTPDPGDPRFCTIIPGSSDGPVFEGHALDGMIVRSFSYDDNGNQNVITNENGETLTLGYDDRGNVTSRTTCRATTQCFTAYSTYDGPATGPLDPRNDLPSATRDGRSTSASDARYRTQYTYAATGDLLIQTNSDGSTVENKYTTGGEGAATGGGLVPAGLALTTTDPRKAKTQYGYYANGDLAKVTEPSGATTTFTYDALGRRLTETETSDAFPAGTTTTYAYNARSQLTTTTEPAAGDAVSGVRHQRVTTNSYDADGNVVKTVVADAVAGGDAPRTETFAYDEHDRMVLNTDAEGNEIALGYDKFGNRTSMVDPNGNHYEYAFTARNVIAEVRLRNWHGDPGGADDPGDTLVLNSYAYDFAGRMVRQTDAMGHTIQHTYYRDGQPWQHILKGFHNDDGTTRDYVIDATTYDGAGNPIQKVDADGELITQNVYNAAGRLESSTADPAGLARRTDYTYDVAGNVLSTTTSGNAVGVPWTTTGTRQVVEHVYDAFGNLSADRVGTGSTALTTSYTYNQRGDRITATDPRGAVGTFAYDELGRRYATTAPAVSAEQNGGAAQTVRPATTTGYDTFDAPVAVRDALGNVRRFTYDRLGRTVSASAPQYAPPGTVAVTPTTTNAYDPLGNVVSNIDARGQTTRYSYDQLSHLVKKDEPGGTDDQRVVSAYTYTRTGDVLSSTDPTGARTETTYDDLDRATTVSQIERRPVTDTLTARYTYDDTGQLRTALSPSGAKSVFNYDKAGELLDSTTPANVTTRYGYDGQGRQVRLSDGLGRTQRTDYDAYGRVSADSDLKADLTTLRTEAYGYDAAGNLASSTDAAHRTTSYTYDALNRLTRQDEPEDITTSFGYDAAGNKTRYTDGRGNATVYTVNTLGLPDSVIEPSTAANPATADRTWTMAYDAGGLATQLRAPGGVVRDRAYDAAGRLTSETGTGTTIATTARTLGYDADDRLTSVSAPGGTDTFTYDDRGNVLGAAGPSGTASFSYNSDGQVSARTDAAGTATFGYVNSQLTSVKDGVSNTTQTLRYDAAGQLSKVDFGSGRIRSYAYDDFGRVSSDTLAGAGGAAVSSVKYEYDLDDHVTRKTTAGTAGATDNSYGYDDAGRLTSWTAGGKTTTYEWDKSGNRIRAGDKRATYDERNRLLSDGDYTYAYTPRGTLASRTSSGLAEKYSFDAFDRLVGDDSQMYQYDGLDRLAGRNGKAFSYAGPSTDPVSDGSELYARGPDDGLLAVADGQDKRLTLSDAHGDVIGDFDPASTGLTNLSDSTAYDPFGVKLATSGSPANLGYQGDYTDPVTGQVDMGARWYDPGSGMFDSRDTTNYSSGDAILANRYTYGAGDPLANSDPDGHWPSCDWCKAIGHVAVSLYNGAKSALAWGKQALVSVYNSGVSAFKWVVNKIGDFAKWAYDKGKEGIRWLGGKLADAAHWVAGKAAAAVSWAKEKAVQAAHVAAAVAQKVTAVAKAAVAYAVQHNPLPAIAAALKPVFSGLASVVSSIASLPAKVVSTVRDVVVDVAKSAEVLYNAAVETVGQVIETVSNAAQAVGEFVADHAATVVGVVAGVVVGVGCGALIGWTGVGAVACGAAAGAVGSVVHDLVEGGHSWQEMAGNALTQGAFGGITGGLGSMAGAALGASARAVFSGAGGAALTAGRTAVTEEAASITSGKLAGGLLRGCNSFTATTSVLMADGTTKAIKDVHAGDVVLATDPTTGKTAKRKVTDQIEGQGEKRLVRLTVDTDGVRGNATADITATDGHPFWSPDLETWVKAADLAAGSWLRTSAGTYVQVTAVTRWTAGDQHVYNLTVDATHTFYVLAGSAAVLVHNCGKDQGIYELVDAFNPGKTYVGKSINLTNRLGEHLRSGRLASLDDVKITHVCGCEGDVFVAEHLRMEELAGRGVALSNIDHSPGRTILDKRGQPMLPGTEGWGQ